ncbi:hypothetical protein PFISCL1PPCAC_15094, partial [Pristionchus fissidentatus]
FPVSMDDQPLETANGHESAPVEDPCFVIPPETADHHTDDDTMEEVRSKTSDANESSRTLMSPVLSSRSHDFDSKRKFRITGLKHPGEWRTHEKLQDLLNRTEQFHIWFDLKQGVKTGGMSLTFDCPEAARNAFAEAQEFELDGSRLRLVASRSFYEPIRRPNHSFTINDDVEIRERTVYAMNLLEGTTSTILETIFEGMEKAEMLPLSEKRLQAEILMTTKDGAVNAKNDVDKFAYEDGKNSSVIEVYTPSEYVDYMARLSRPPSIILSPTPSSSLTPALSRSNSNVSTCSKPLFSPVKTHHKESEKTTVKLSRPPPVPLPLPSQIPENEPAVSEVVAAINRIVEEERINWAEISEREEMYELVDKVSYSLGGIRDGLLKESLLSVMESSRGEAQDNSWMRRHLDGLIKLWKKEITSETIFERPTRVPLQARVINPIPAEKKRKRGGGAELRAQYGIGAILASARAKFATEEGELEIEETDDGNILIGAVPLSFESWARFNKQPLKRTAPKEEQSSTDSKENRRVKRAKMEEEKKNKKKKKKEEEKTKKEADKPMKELEEGEMASDSDGEKKSSSSSSSSSSDSDGGGDSRRRRRFKRKNDRTKPPSLPPLFQSIYDNRHAIISQLDVEHRIAFSEVIKTFVNKKGGIDSTQQQALMTYMNAYGR